MALQTFPTNELIRLYQTVLARVRSNPDHASESRRDRLAAIGAELDRRSTAITCNLYQSLAS